MKSFKQHIEEQEAKELEEFLGTIPFNIATTKWVAKNKGTPSGKDNWKFDFIIPVLQAGQGFLDDGQFSFKGLYKKAVKALAKFLKKRAGKEGNVKQAKVNLVP
tara:strand:+ start:166 stop:477 length:312 start_codon:yes stop_codon:yes gene_type:complete